MKKTQGCRITLCTIMAAFLFSFVFHYGMKGMDSLSPRVSFFISADLFSLLIALVCYMVVIIDKEDSSPIYLWYRLLLACSFFGLYFSAIGLEGEYHPHLNAMQMASLTIAYLGAFIIPLFIWKLLDSLEERRRKTEEYIFLLFIVVSIGFLVLNLFYPLFFYVDETGVPRTTPYFGYYAFTPLLLFLVAFIRILCMKVDWRTKAIFASLTMIPIVGSFGSSLRNSQTLSLDYCFIILSLLLVYAYLFTERSYRLAKAKEALKQKEFERHEQRQRMLMSQIQPHFIFNTLSIIGILCHKDPEKAYETTVDFADYLRHNLESLSTDPMIPFSKELDHVKKYVNIQKTRFGEELTVLYDIQKEDFLVPSLSIQPLVENAVMHGIIRGKEEDGTVTISSYEEENAYIITIQDDGIGFDVTKKKDDGRNHVGLSSSKERIETLAGGQLIIDSVIGKGTIQKIIIPKKEVKA